MLTLIIDDDSDDREIFAEAVRSIDPAITCLEARDGEEGLSLLANELTILPDFVFLDINMPRMNGFECLVKMKEDDRLKDIQVVIYSTTGTQHDIRKFASLGAAFLAKQAEYQELLKRLRIIFQK